MIPVFPDGQYSHPPWNNANDRVEWERTFAVGTDAQKRMAVAMITASPDTPEAMIRLNMTMPPPPAPAPLSVTQMTLDDVLGTSAKADTGHMYDRAPTDFSGTPGHGHVGIWPGTHG